MPTIGKSNLFPAAVVMREVAALASYCDGMIPSVHKLVICTPNDSTLNVYRSLFEGPEWRAVMKESQVFETCRLGYACLSAICCHVPVVLQTCEIPATVPHIRMVFDSTIMLQPAVYHDKAILEFDNVP